MELSPSTRKILNDPLRIARRDAWFRRLEEVGQNPHNQKNVFAVNGILGHPARDDLLLQDPERWVAESLEDLAAQADRSDTDWMFTPLCIESAIYGVHFVDSLFGSEVYFQDGQWYNRRLATPVGSLEPPDLERCPAWETARRAALEFVRQEVALPLFGLPTIASVLNIAVNLYGEDILADMLLEPELARHDFEVIHCLLCHLHEWYRSVIPMQQLQPVISWNRTQPPGCGQLCGCTTQLVSASAYQEMIAPLDDQLLAVYPKGGMIHLCGSHSHLIDSFRSMPHLRALQLNDRAAEDLALYFEGLRDDQILYVNPCEKMTVEQAAAITGGKRLVIADTIPENAAF